LSSQLTHCKKKNQNRQDKIILKGVQMQVVVNNLTQSPLITLNLIKSYKIFHSFKVSKIN